MFFGICALFALFSLSVVCAQLLDIGRISAARVLFLFIRFVVFDKLELVIVVVFGGYGLEKDKQGGIVGGGCEWL